MQSSNGSLTILDPHSANTQDFWNGIKIQGLLNIRVFDGLKDDNSGDVRIRVLKGLNPSDMILEMQNAGVNVREVLK